MLNEELFNKSSKMIKTIYYPTKNSLDLLNIEQLFINNKETANIFYKILKNINSIKQSDYDDKLEILLNSHIIIPITSDIMWYNNSYYIYPLEKDNKMKKESEQKLFYITNIINQTIEEIEKQGYSKNIPNQLKYKNAFYYNDEENNTIIEDNKYSTDPMILNLLQISSNLIQPPSSNLLFLGIFLLVSYKSKASLPPTNSSYISLVHANIPIGLFFFFVFSFLFLFLVEFTFSSNFFNSSNFFCCSSANKNSFLNVEGGGNIQLFKRHFLANSIFSGEYSEKYSNFGIHFVSFIK